MENRQDFSFDWDLSRSQNSPNGELNANSHQDHNHEYKADEDQCAVCLSPGEDTMLLPCTHQFHGKCILRWVDQNFSCPLCRQEIAQFVPLNTTDSKIHQQFVDIWERHHYGDRNEQKKSTDGISSENDRFSTSKQREISLSEVSEIEKVDEPHGCVAHCDDNEQTVDKSSFEINPREEIKVPEEDIIITESRVQEILPDLQDLAQVEVKLSGDDLQLEFPYASEINLSNLCQTQLRYTPIHSQNLENGIGNVLFHTGKNICQRFAQITCSIWERFNQQTEEEETPILTVSIPRPTFYKLNESMEAGFLAGALTASMLAAASRPANLYPLVREVVPNVAIFFTVYEDLKYRNMNPSTDTELDSFWKRTASAGCAATLGHLPQNRFKCTVPVRFGLQFGFFEFFKDRLCVMRGDLLKDHSNLSPFDIGASAFSGGVIAATCAFPVELYMKYMDVGRGTYFGAYQTFMRKFLPGCVFTALSFEFGRRWIHNEEEN